MSRSQSTGFRCGVTLLAVFLAAAASAASRKELQEAVEVTYPSVLAAWAAGDGETALGELTEMETDLVAPDYERKRVEAMWKAKLGVIRDLMSTAGPNVLPPIMLLHHDAYLAYRERGDARASLRGAFADARGYPARFMAHNEGDTLTRADAQAFGRAVRGQQLMIIAARRASDLRMVMDLKEENPNLNLAIVGADEGWIVADELADAGIPVIIDPFQNLPASFSQLGATSKNAERLIDAGVTTAFAHLGSNSHQARLVLQSAGNAAANGVSFDDAMAAMTTVPAAIFEVENYGTIERGHTADLVIWDGDPLEVSSAPIAVFIDGEAQSLESRQTKLRDRYLDLDENEKPLAYKN